MLLIALTVLPAVAIAVYFITSDRFIEPTGTILFSLFLGLVICFPAGVLNTVLIRNQEDPNSLAYLAAITEEPLKFLMIFFFKKSHEFDEPMDALVYGTVVSLGFAILENFGYVHGADSETSSYAIATLRAFTAIPMHASCGVVMGYYFGRYMFSGSRRHLVMSLAVPIFSCQLQLPSVNRFAFFPFAPDRAGRLLPAFTKVFIQEQKLKAAETEKIWVDLSEP